MGQHVKKPATPGDLVYEGIGWGDRAELEVLHVYEDNSILVHEPGLPGDFIKSYISYDPHVISCNAKVRRLYSWELWNEKKQDYDYVTFR